MDIEVPIFNGKKLYNSFLRLRNNSIENIPDFYINHIIPYDLVFLIRKIIGNPLSYSNIGFTSRRRFFRIHYQENGKKNSKIFYFFGAEHFCNLLSKCLYKPGEYIEYMITISQNRYLKVHNYFLIMRDIVSAEIISRECSKIVIESNE